MPAPTTLFRASWDAAELTARHPPVFKHPNKRVVQEVACPPGSTAAGTVTVSRWRDDGLPGVGRGELRVRVREGYYPYEPDAPATIGWYQNFADEHVFGYYAGGLFAQDEAQVSEHPALVSVREALVAAGHALSAERGAPTPVLVTGVERRVVVDTEPSLDPGRMQGLYGNRFATASPEVIRSASRRIDPATRSNIVAMAAPTPASGTYTVAQIGRILLTAYTGYAAAVAESASVAPTAAVVMHTGFWGCGAFGGNRTLMVAAQILAARWAGVSELVLHVGARPGLHDAAEAQSVANALPASVPLADVMTMLEARRFQWGRSDGN